MNNEKIWIPRQRYDEMKDLARKIIVHLEQGDDPEWIEDKARELLATLEGVMDFN